MCLYPRYIKNKRYQSYKVKKGDIVCDDWRKMYVPIGCGECYECRRQKAQQWRVRLMEELKVQKYAYFVTLTFSNESLRELAIKENIEENKLNAIATLAVRRFLERWRKAHKKSLKHWLITELGHENTERIHLHGIIFNETPLNNDILQHYWKYGHSDIGEYCNEQTINYIVKYITKIDTDHKSYKAVILCSAGIGAAYVETYEAKEKYKYHAGKTPEYYTLKNGMRVALPIYYRNKLFTQNERDRLWTERLDKGSIYVNGIEIKDIYTDEAQKYYYELLKQQQKWNVSVGYGSTAKEWQKEEYNLTFKMLQRKKI